MIFTYASEAPSKYKPLFFCEYPLGTCVPSSASVTVMTKDSDPLSAPVLVYVVCGTLKLYDAIYGPLIIVQKSSEFKS